MPRLDWILDFAQVSFPVFLLIPTIIAAFEIPVPPTNYAVVTVMLWIDYAVIVTALAWTSVVQKDMITLIFLAVLALIGALILFFVLKWTNDEILWKWIS